MRLAAVEAIYGELAARFPRPIGPPRRGRVCVSAREVIKAAAAVVAHARRRRRFVASFALRAAIARPRPRAPVVDAVAGARPGPDRPVPAARVSQPRRSPAAITPRSIEFGTIFSRAGARLDEHVYIGPGCHLGLVHLERDVLIASGVHMPSGANDAPHRRPRGRSASRRAASGWSASAPGSWIGERAVVMADVGANSVVGAGAVVTQPVPCMVGRGRRAGARAAARAQTRPARAV